MPPPPRPPSSFFNYTQGCRKGDIFLHPCFTHSASDRGQQAVCGGSGRHLLTNTMGGGGCLHVSLSFCMSERVNEVYERVCVCAWWGLGLGLAGPWPKWDMVTRLCVLLGAVCLQASGGHQCSYPNYQVHLWQRHSDCVWECLTHTLSPHLLLTLSSLSHTYYWKIVDLCVCVFSHFLCSRSCMFLFFFFGGGVVFILFLSLTGAVVGNTFCILFVLFV